MRKRGEEESTARIAWLEKNVKGDLRQASTSYNEREGVQGGRETSDVGGLETVALTKYRRRR